MLAAHQLECFKNQGVLKIPKLVPKQLTQVCENNIWKTLSHYSLRKDNPDKWHELSQKEISHTIRRIRRIRGLRETCTEEMTTIASELVRSKDLTQQIPMILFTPPSTATSEMMWGSVEKPLVPSRFWHTDAPRLPNGATAGVIALTLLDRLEETGGGTMFVQGSHRLFDDRNCVMSSKQFKKRLKRLPYFADLFSAKVSNRSRFLRNSECVDGVRLKVVQTDGEAGDVYFVNAGILHTITPNHLDSARIMSRNFFASPSFADYCSKSPRMETT